MISKVSSMIAKLLSDKVKERRSGYDHLCQWLDSLQFADNDEDSENRNTHNNLTHHGARDTYFQPNSNCSSDKDDAVWLRLIESYCRFSETEQGLAISKTKTSFGSKTVRTTIGSAPTIQMIGETFSKICDVYARIYPFVVVQSTFVMDHVLHTLKCASGQYAEENAYSAAVIKLLYPLRFSYALGLRHLLRARLIRSHLTADIWDRLFILITDILAPQENDMNDKSTSEITDTHFSNSYITNSTSSQNDRRPDSAELAESLTFLVSGYHLSHIFSRAGDILRTATRYLQMYRGESNMASCMLGCILFVISHIAVDHLDGSLDILDTTMPFMLDMWECRSVSLKAHILNIARMFLILNKARDNHEPFTLGCVNRIATLIISSWSLRMSTSAFDLVFDSILTDTYFSVKHALSSHRMVDRSAQTEIILLETDLASLLLCWQLEHMYTTSETNEFRLKDEQTLLLKDRANDSECDSPRKRFCKSAQTLVTELTALIQNAIHTKTKALYIHLLAISASRRWDLCKDYVHKHLNVILQALTSSNTQVKEASLLLVYVLVSNICLKGDLAQPTINSSCTYIDTSSVQYLNSDHKNLSEAWMIPEIWFIIVSKASHSESFLSIRVGILSIMAAHRLVPNSQLVKYYTEEFLSNVSTAMIIGSPLETQFQMRMYPLLLDLETKSALMYWKIAMSSLTTLFSEEMLGISSTHISCLAESILASFGFDCKCHKRNYTALYNTNFSSNQLLFEIMFESIQKNVGIFKESFNIFPCRSFPHTAIRQHTDVHQNVANLEQFFAFLIPYLNDTIISKEMMSFQSETTSATNTKFFKALSALLIFLLTIFQTVSVSSDIRESDLNIQEKLQQLQDAIGKLAGCWVTRLHGLISLNVQWSTEILCEVFGWISYLPFARQNSMVLPKQVQQEFHLLWPTSVSTTTDMILSVTQASLDLQSLDNPISQQTLKNQGTTKTKRQLRCQLGASMSFEVACYDDLVENPQPRSAVLLSIAHTALGSLCLENVPKKVLEATQEMFIYYIQQPSLGLLLKHDLIVLLTRLEYLSKKDFFYRLMTVIMCMLQGLQMEKCDEYLVFSIEMINVIFSKLLDTNFDEDDANQDGGNSRASLMTFIRFVSIQGVAKKLSNQGLSGLLNLIERVQAVNSTFPDFDCVDTLLRLLNVSNFQSKLLWADKGVSILVGCSDSAQYEHIHDCVAKQMSSDPVDDAELVSTCAIYAFLAVASKGACMSAIVSIVRLINDDTNVTVLRVLDKISVQLGFSSLNLMLRTFFIEIINDAGSVSQCPWSILGDLTSEQQFFAQYLEFLIPLAVKTESLAKFLGEIKNAKDLLISKFGVVYGELLPLTFDANHGTKAKAADIAIFEACGLQSDNRCKEMLRFSSTILYTIFLKINGWEVIKNIDHERNKIDSLLVGELDQIQPWTPPSDLSLPCCHFINLLEPVPSSQISNVSECIQSIHDFCNTIKFKKISDLLKPQRLQKIVHKLHCIIHANPLPLYRRSWLYNGYTMLMVMAQEHWFHPFIFRSSLQFLLQQASHEFMVGTCCGIIEYMVNKSLKLGFPENLLDNFGYLCATLSKLGEEYQQRGLAIDAAYKNYSDTHNHCHWAAKACASLLKLLLELFGADNTDSIQLAILNVDMKNSLFSDQLEKYLADNISTCVVKKALLNSKVQSPAPLQYFQRILDTPSTHVSDWLSDLEISHLFNVLQDLASSIFTTQAIRTEALKSLAKLSLFTTHTQFVQSTLLSSIDTSLSTMSKDIFFDEFFLKGYIVVLQFLAHSLLDTDLDVISVTIKTLSTIATKELIETAIPYLSARDVAFIRLFTGRSQSGRELPISSTTASCLCLDTMFMNSETPMIWSQNIATALLATYTYTLTYSGLSKMFEIRPELADMILPYLFYTPLADELDTSDSVRKELSCILNAFFEKATKKDAYAISKLINVVHFMYKCPAPHSIIRYEWFDLDYSAVSRAAALVNPLEALFFIETQHVKSHDPDNTPTSSTWNTLRECYASLNELDSFEGVISHYRHDTDSILIQKYEHGHQWGKIMSLMDTRLQLFKVNGESKDQASAYNDELKLCKALSQSGQYHILEKLLESIFQSMGSEKGQDAALPDSTQSSFNLAISELRHECFWRIGRWNMLTTDSGSKKPEKSIYASLKALYTLPFSTATYTTLLKSLTDLTGHKRAFPDLLCIVEAIEVYELLIDSDKSFTAMLDLWNSRLKQVSEHESFLEIERLMTFRIQLLFSFRQACINANKDIQVIDQFSATYLVDLSRQALSNQYFHTSQHAIQRFSELNTQSLPWQSLDMEIQKLKLYWLQGDQALAIGLLKDLIDKKKTILAVPVKENRNAYASLLCLLGDWSSQNQSQTPQNIVRKYLLPASDIRSQIDSISAYTTSTTHASEYYQLARFCDQILHEMESDDTHIRANQVLQDRQEELRQYITVESTTHTKHERISIDRAKTKLVKQIDIDQAEANRYNREMSVYLKLSVQNYMKALTYSTQHSEETVFRLCSLWFSHSTNTSLQETIAKKVDTLPTHKFLVLMYQISARLMSSTPSAYTESTNQHNQTVDKEVRFCQVLEILIIRIIKEYPYHSLPHLIAFKNGADGKSNPSHHTLKNGALGINHSENECQQPINSAQKILDVITADKSLQTSTKQASLNSIILSLDGLFNLYMQVAELKHDKKTAKPNKQNKNSKGYLFESGLLISKYTENSSVPILTLEQSIGTPGDWSNIVHVFKFEKSYTLPGGINAPKVIKCIGNNGKEYQQLVKGNEDLRQDAVLSSIFSMVNVLLLKKFESRKRKLNIRTYKITPMSPQTGVIEWVNGTVPIGTILVDAHQRYRPTDLTTSDCRQLMMKEHERVGSDSASKLAVYQTIMNQFKPVFSQVLLERFTDAREWLQCRTRYTRSVAANSMAGYIVGVGDRHAQNILFDCQTAEVVHIDLGIAFDQGKLLSIPELVPFRLTRDMVDCMGMTGIEGVFRKGCEETLRVLRQESSAISMLLDVFLHDPLYNWKISPLKLKRLQKKSTVGSTENEVIEQISTKSSKIIRSAGTAHKEETRGREEAARAIFGVHKKLSSTLGLECQVSQLISTAVDANNLSRMFPGW
ncbi:Serine/threonine-protein kinase tel1 [Batrachochytrium dendrobatidis]|nr:Serine/threonine-protein kinase tel1 [Batrachochytrium dendrobatidis]